MSSTVVVAAKKTQKCAFRWHPSRTLISISQLPGLKNQRFAALLLPPGTTRAGPVEKTIALPEDQAGRLQSLAYERGTSEDSLIREAIEAYVTKKA